MADPAEAAASIPPTSPGRSIRKASTTLHPPSSIMVAKGGAININNSSNSQNNNKSPRNESTAKSKIYTTASHEDSDDSLLGDNPPKPEHKRSSVRSGSRSSSTSSSSSSPIKSPYGMAGGIPTKFQFHKPSSNRSPKESVTVLTDFASDSISRVSDDAADAAVEGGGGGGRERGSKKKGGGKGGTREKKEIAKNPTSTGAASATSASAAATSFGGKNRSKKGVDPPENELPTRFLQMQRELQLQSGANVTGSSGHVTGGGRKGSEKPTSTLQGMDSKHAWQDDSDDNVEYPKTPMDPIESDEEFSPIPTKNKHPLAKAVSSALAAAQMASSPRPTPSTSSQQQQQQQHPMFRSPVSLGGRNTANPPFQNSIQHPHSIKSLPPQQLMQYLHAGGRSDGTGRGSALQRGQIPYGGVAGAHGVMSPPFQRHAGQIQNNSSSTFSHSLQRRNSYGQEFPQQAGPSTRRATDVNSHQLYSDGIELLKKTACEAREREEVDTLNLGINYLQKMGTDLEKGDSRTNQHHVIPPLPLQQNQHYSPRKAAPPSPASFARLHPPPEKGGKLDKARSMSLGVHDMLSISESSASVWQQQQEQGERPHRYPPPTKTMSNPCTPTTYYRPRPGITAADAMNFVLNASIQPPFRRNSDFDEAAPNHRSDTELDEIAKDQAAKDLDSIQILLTNLREENGKFRAKQIDDTEVHAIKPRLVSNKKRVGPSHNNAADGGLSINSADQDDDDDFERSTSLSMHAEDKIGLPSVEQSPAVSGNNMDPPDGYDETIHGEDDFELQLKQNACIHLPTAEYQEFPHEVESVDREILPRFASQFNDVNGNSSVHKSNALGPRSQRPGGTTGIVLEDGISSKVNRDYAYRKKNAIEKSRIQPSSSDSSQNSSDDDDPQSVLDDSLGCVPRQKCYNYSSSEGLSREENDEEATSLMIKLCSHLIPDGIDITQNSSLASLVSIDSTKLEWDDDDPDEPGYVVHQLTKIQLMEVENAFDNVIAPLLQALETHPHQGSNNNNFEHDLTEAEVVLDKEEIQFKLVAENKSNTTESSNDLKIQSLSLQAKEMLHEFVPDFPGIFPPGKGKTGDMECFYLPIITSSQKTGFEPTKDIVLKPGTVFANNYLVQGELGSAAFSTAYRCLDLCSEVDEDGFQDEVCLKVIKNTKDYFDQSLDEIKILQLLKDTGRVKENNIVEMKSYFYHREHLVIVTELLRQNLYEFGKSIVESEGPLYFTRARLSHIIRQCLIALKFVHNLGLMHCDIKPENILLCSYSRALVKIIDFGSSSFVTDRQSSYIQSRSYRAPEVILGLPHDGKIDLWSLGCVVAEMYTNEVTFQNDSEVSMLSRIEAICGPFPRHMIANGRNSHRIFTDCGLIYEKISPNDADSTEDETDKTLFDVYQPKMTSISARLGFDEDLLDQPHLSDDVSIRRLNSLYFNGR